MYVLPTRTRPYLTVRVHFMWVPGHPASSGLALPLHSYSVALPFPSLVSMRVETNMLCDPYMYFDYHGYSVEPSCPGKD